MRFRLFLCWLWILCLGHPLTGQDSFSGLTPEADEWGDERYSAFIIGAQAGYSGFLYKSGSARMLSSYGGSVSILYHYGFNPKWAYNIGAEFRHLQGRCHMGLYHSELPRTDLEGERFIFNTHIEGYSERQSSFGISIPFSITRYIQRFFISAGVLVHIPIQASAYSKMDQFQTIAYYPNYDVYLENLPDLGFFNQENWQNTFDFKLPTMYGPRLEFGFQTPLGDRSTIRISLMFNYTFGFVKASHIGPLVDYSASDQGTLSFRPSVYSVEGVRNGARQRYPIHHLEAGLRISFGFGQFGSNLSYW